MHAISTNTLDELGAMTQAPCLSLYHPTHRSHPDNQQDTVHFRHGVDALAESLKGVHGRSQAQTLLEPFHRLAADTDFWSHTLDGLAAFSSPKGFRVFVLPRTMPTQAIVADSFHTKPLRRFLQSVDRYQVLCLTPSSARLYEGNRDALVEVTVHDDVLMAGARANHPSGYFRALDRALMEHHSKPTGLPLILAALPEHHHLFRQLSHNHFLLPRGLEIDPNAVDTRALSLLAWAMVEPQHNVRQQVWIDAYVVAKALGRGSDDLRKTATAAAQGRVAMMLIEAERSLAGQLNQQTGNIIRLPLSEPTADDLLDDIADLVQSKGGEVRVIPARDMPTHTGLAAAFRH